MDNGVPSGLHFSSCPSLWLFVLNSLTLTWRIWKKRTPGLSLFKYVKWISFWATLSTTFHRKLVGNPSICRFVQQDTCTGVWSGWEKAESGRKRESWDEGERETDESYILMWLKKMEEEEVWEEEERETGDSYILMCLKKMEEEEFWQEANKISILYYD